MASLYGRFPFEQQIHGFKYTSWSWVLAHGEELGLSALHDIETYWLGRKRPCHRRVALAEP
jgi:hypothetical protein